MQVGVCRRGGQRQPRLGQLPQPTVQLSVAWRPRDENTEADALTNGVFAGFREDLRVHLCWADLRFIVLPRLVKSAGQLFDRMAAERREQRQPKAARVRRVPLREREPW